MAVRGAAAAAGSAAAGAVGTGARRVVSRLAGGAEAHSSQ
eukprot:gene33319-30400_t